MRRDGKSLGQMAREEIGTVGGFAALLAVLLIMILLLAVVGLVVVNALSGSPWGTFTIAATMPIALFMGCYLRYWRPGKVLECSIIGFGLTSVSSANLVPRPPARITVLIAKCQSRIPSLPQNAAGTTLQAS